MPKHYSTHTDDDLHLLEQGRVADLLPEGLEPQWIPTIYEVTHGPQVAEIIFVDDLGPQLGGEVWNLKIYFRSSGILEPFISENLRSLESAIYFAHAAMRGLNPDDPQTLSLAHQERWLEQGINNLTQ